MWWLIQFCKPLPWCKNEGKGIKRKPPTQRGVMEQKRMCLMSEQIFAPSWIGSRSQRRKSRLLHKCKRHLRSLECYRRDSLQSQWCALIECGKEKHQLVNEWHHCASSNDCKFIPPYQWNCAIHLECLGMQDPTCPNERFERMACHFDTNQRLVHSHCDHQRSSNERRSSIASK